MSTTNETEVKTRDAIRTDKIKIVTNEETRTKLTQLATLCQQAHNRLIHEIRSWHVEQGNDIKVLAWINEFKIWSRTRDARYAELLKELPKTLTPKEKRERKEKISPQVKKEMGNAPKCPVHFMVKEGDAIIRKRMVSAFPGLHSATLTQLMKSAMDDLGKHKCKVSCYDQNRENMDGRFKQWHRIVASLGEQKTYTKMQPIPLKKSQMTVNPPQDPFDDKATWTVDIRMDRWQDTKDGKPRVRSDGKPLCKSTIEVFELVTKEAEQKKETTDKNGKKKKPRPKLGRIRSTLRQCYGFHTSPETQYIPKGATINEHKGEWYIHLPYQQMKWVPMDCDKRKVAVLKPAEKHPWDLAIGTQTIKVKGHGNVIAYVRRGLLIQGQTRRAAAQGGREKARGYRRVHRRAVTMDNFKRTFSRQTIAQVLKIMSDRRIGTLELHLPTFKPYADRTYLAKAGTINRPESWPWEFVKNELQRHAERLKFKLTIKELKYPKKKKDDGDDETPPIAKAFE